jgi:hypothetical protein
MLIFDRWPLRAVALAGALAVAGVGARADEPGYPNLNGQWSRGAQGANWDPSKPGGLRQQAPLTAEYQALFEANLKPPRPARRATIRTPAAFHRACRG